MYDPQGTQPLTDPALSETPKNATDRNVVTATGMWRGHITLPSAFLSGCFIMLCASFLIVIYWCFDQQTQLRDRIRALEVINARLIQAIAPTVPLPVIPTPPSDKNPLPLLIPPPSTPKFRAE